MKVPGRKDRNEVMHNTKIMRYPDGSSKVVCCSKPIFREPGYESAEAPLWKPANHQEKRSYNMDNPTRSDSLRRSRQSVYDIAFLNSFSHFVTLTIAPENCIGIDRNDPVQVGRYVDRFFRNQAYRHGVSYLLVPEPHKDCAIHIHGFVSGFDVVNSGTVKAPGYSKPIRLDTALKKGFSPDDLHTVYNIPAWTLGFSTAIEPYGVYEYAVRYLLEYVTKDSKKIFGKFYFSGGKGLIRKPPMRLTDLDFSSVNAPSYDVEQAGLSFKYFDFKGDCDYDDPDSP